jgi:hypothetical protein
MECIEPIRKYECIGRWPELRVGFAQSGGCGDDVAWLRARC